MAPFLHRAALLHFWCRRFSAQQAAVALRPFYFLVHPDRFARLPEVQRRNEKALQVFNGYLNELFPQPRSQKAVRIRFSILKDQKLKDVELDLSGSDPLNIVRHALEGCELSTEMLPAITPPLTTEASLWDELHRTDRRKRSRRRESVMEQVVKHKLQAVEKRKAYSKTKEFIQDEMDYVQSKTGVSQIVWVMPWDTRYMRRCILNVLQMLNQADPETRERVIMALHNHVLLFGRGSYVCCDGSIQFGADDVSESWMKVCIESTVRRFEVRNLARLVDRACELLGGATVIIDPKSNLLQTTHQLQSLITRISSRPVEDREKLKCSGSNLEIEICNSYNELSVADTGRIHVPCNVDGRYLLEFLTDKRSRSLEVKERRKRDESTLDAVYRHCMGALQLRNLSWDSSISIHDLVACIQKLTSLANESLDVKDLHLHITRNINMSVRPDGSIAVPYTYFHS